MEKNELVELLCSKINLEQKRYKSRILKLKPEEIYGMIEGNSYPMEDLEWYRRQFLPEELGKSTAKVVDLIEENLN